MAKALIGLGSNRGDRQQNLRSALDRLNASPEIRVRATSQWHSTRPVGGPLNQPEFLNAAAVVETELSPLQLLQLMQTIEHRLGRRRDIRWDARTLDLDLLLFEDFRSLDPDLVVPHPRMIFRSFVLLPALEIAAAWIHPVLGWSLDRVAEFMKQTPTRVELCGFNLLGRQNELRAIADRTGAERLTESQPMNLKRFRQWEEAEQIEFMHARAERMRTEKWMKPKTAVVSGFSREESCLFDHLAVKSNKQRNVELTSLWSQCPVAKLKVLWQPPDLNQAEKEFIRNLEVALNHQNASPEFHITAESTDVLVDEVSAAIECLETWCKPS